MEDEEVLDPSQEGLGPEQDYVGEYESGQENTYESGYDGAYVGEDDGAYEGLFDDPEYDPFEGLSAEDKRTLGAYFTLHKQGLLPQYPASANELGYQDAYGAHEPSPYNDYGGYSSPDGDYDQTGSYDGYQADAYNDYSDYGVPDDYDYRYQDEDASWRHGPTDTRAWIAEEAERIAEAKQAETLSVVRPILEQNVLHAVECPDEAKPYFQEAVRRVRVDDLTQPGTAENLAAWAIGQAVLRGTYNPWGSERMGTEPAGSTAGPIGGSRGLSAAKAFERFFGVKPDRDDLEAMGIL